ncbi:hypothetical protein, partial [Burkholderia sp.]|uniref:hypothetical protein n=1 Tax=Burkholderia sp. TaxID=36773 RepID=UPI002585A829
MKMKSGFEGFGQDRSFSFVLIITPAATGMTTSTSRDRVGIFTDESNSFRRSWCARVEHAWKDAASGPGGRAQANRFSFAFTREGGRTCRNVQFVRRNHAVARPERP